MTDKYPYRREDFLRRKYELDGMTIDEIADDCDVDYATIHYWMEKNKIERRRRGTERVPWAYFGVNGAGYEVAGAKAPRGNTEWVYIHRLAAVAWFGFDAVAGMDVHHSNGGKRDNRESNLETLTASRHMQIHNEQRRRRASADDTTDPATP